MVYGEFSHCFIVEEADIQRSSNRLIIFWILFLLYGVIETARGKIPLNRAIPAGAFLLLFIGIFGWSAYRMGRVTN
jgi:hypothetical protein